MDEVDFCNLPRKSDQIETRDFGVDEVEGIRIGNVPAEDIFQNRSGKHKEGQWLASPHPGVGEPVDCGGADGTLTGNASLEKGFFNGHDQCSHAPEVDSQCSALESFQTAKHSKSQADLLGIGCYLTKEPASFDKALHDDHTCELTGQADFSLYLRGNGNCDNTSSIGVDDTDQGQVLRMSNLTGENEEFHQWHRSTRSYAKPESGIPKSLPSDAKVTESAGLSTNSLPTAIRDSLRNDNSLSSRAIDQSGGTTAQGQLQHNSKPSPESSPQEVAKRRVCLADERGVEDSSMSSMMKKQKVSPTVQSDVQFNQSILTMPKEYNVSGRGNCIFDSPNNCTFNLYQNPSGSQSQRQHAFEWAGVVSQTDSGSDEGELPTQALETVAKLVANTTNWKTFARRLPMSENGNLESDIKTLEDCQGTTSDKTAAVLMRWWKKHPKQKDSVVMKAQLKEGLESCSLIRTNSASTKTTTET